MMRRLLLAGFLWWSCPAQGQDLVQGVQVETVMEGRKTGTPWFHPRGCSLPGGTVFWTLQSIHGSDSYGPVMEMTTRDAGKSWSNPLPVPPFAMRAAADGLKEGVCDVVPEFHPKTQTILAMGHNLFYRGDRFFTGQPPRHTVYAVRTLDGKWSDLKKLEWNNPRGSYMYTCGCAQRVVLPDGRILIPLSFGPSAKAVRSVAVLECSFDGRELKILKTGQELKGSVGRGFLEPSLAEVGGVYYLTIRAEDGHGYVATSTDGLTWKEPRAWRWDSGEDIAMSTTQQRWLVHSDGLYLVYTRQAPENAKVMRWRAPLYLAQVDLKTLRLKKDTERIAIPLIGDGVKAPQQVAHLGNFHTQAISPEESWITVGEVIPANYRGDLLLARVRWNKPNRLAPRP